ncbi:MAG TPA: hypothetical protein VJG30_00805 [Candidatus Nanoarchaeia archaeon]|nr:hypothetical protein [Candidatus Nanoarchaeia archaeon]
MVGSILIKNIKHTDIDSIFLHITLIVIFIMILAATALLLVRLSGG